ncbi:uncharacterized protein BJ212DRAFT_1590707 [Suillus subaureus]|uniref:Uncharacterized protein n=1 Tax=Suillus subaureus TaxID=48587 RepID=A0A9P7DXP9_9AGAM|nr:uncharacterized protein BJ212DRAFT_1590707 [Suillus subaureus]KAG1805643.1 hypothetical protein BJ212DRAFT_1590707 [Suillus subaureus]
MSDWSELASSVFSQASDALTEAKQRVNGVIAQENLDSQNIEWSKVSGNVLSRASDALTEARQLVNQAASQRDIDLQNVDWSKLSANIMSRASDALTEARQLINQAASQSDIGLQNVDWSKLSANVMSRASDALTEARQFVNQAASQRYMDLQNVGWSKVSSNVLSRASDALTEARQLVNQVASQRYTDLQNVDWSKLSANIMSRASDALTDAKQLVDQIVSQKYLYLTSIDWSKVLGNILSHASSVLATARQLVTQVFIYHNWRSAMAIISQQLQKKLRPLLDVFSSILHNCRARLWGSILSSVLFALTEVNKWSIVHPYTSAGALVFISAFEDLPMLLALLQLTGMTTMLLCFLPVRLINWCFGFRSQGVEKGSFASQYQSRRYGGNVPRGSRFAELQSYGATMPTVISALVSLLSYTGAVIILGREWWIQSGDWYRFVSNGSY